MQPHDHQAFLLKLEPFRKEREKERRLKKAEIQKNLLDDLKKKHISEKRKEIDELKKRLHKLENEFESYK